MVTSKGNALGLVLSKLCNNRIGPAAATMQPLIAAGANVNFEDGLGMTILSIAVYYGHLNAVKMLLTVEGIDICARNMIGNTAFELACIGGHAEIAKELLAAAYKKTSNFDINDKDSAGRTVLMLSCGKQRHVKIIKLLLSTSNINIHLKNKEGKTALELLATFPANQDEIRALFQGELLPSSSAS
jgi:ankyrin repeat protein